MAQTRRNRGAEVKYSLKNINRSLVDKILPTTAGHDHKVPIFCFIYVFITPKIFQRKFQIDLFIYARLCFFSGEYIWPTVSPKSFCPMLMKPPIVAFLSLVVVPAREIDIGTPNALFIGG